MKIVFCLRLGIHNADLGKGGFIIPTGQGGFINPCGRQNRPNPQGEMPFEEIATKNVSKCDDEFHINFFCVGLASMCSSGVSFQFSTLRGQGGVF